MKEAKIRVEKRRKGENCKEQEETKLNYSIIFNIFCFYR